MGKDVRIRVAACGAGLWVETRYVHLAAFRVAGECGLRPGVFVWRHRCHVTQLDLSTQPVLRYARSWAGRKSPGPLVV